MGGNDRRPGRSERSGRTPDGARPGRDGEGADRARGPREPFRLSLDGGREGLLSRAEEMRLARSAERGDPRARERLVKANLRLVVSIAKRYQGLGVPLADLVQEGAVGLCRAVERFDWRRGCRLSTYATWWITKSIQRGLAAGGHTIRLPEHVVDLQRRVRSAEARLGHELARQPTTAEIAARLGTSEQRVREAAEAAAAILSTSGGAGEQSLETLVDRAPGPDAVAEATLTGEALRRALGTLPAQERAVVELRYGLGGAPDCSIELVARRLGLETRRARALERAALLRLAAVRELRG